MGKADWECYTGCDLVGSDASKDILRIYCYWKCNGWGYNMRTVTGYTYFQGGNQVCVFNGAINFQDIQSTNLLGYNDYICHKGHNTISSSYQSRIISSASYESGDKWSGVGYFTTNGVRRTVITYNANGGSDAPGHQDKWYGETLYLSNTRPTRTGYIFRCWNTAPNGTGTNYVPGYPYDLDPGGTVTLYAIWDIITYPVKYYGNDDNVTNVPSSQTKVYGQTLTLSNGIPVKNEYTFLGWATSPDGDIVYLPGDSYTSNTALNLYAKWIISYVRPKINNISIFRTNWYKGTKITGTSTTPTIFNESGIINASINERYLNTDTNYTYICTVAGDASIAKWKYVGEANPLDNIAYSEGGTNLCVSFDWETFLNTNIYAKIQFKEQTDSIWKDITVINNQTIASQNGSINNYIITKSNTIDTFFDVNKSYSVRILVYDKKGVEDGDNWYSYSGEISIGTAKFPIDVKNGGKGIAFGKVAEIDNLMDVGFNARFREPVQFDNNLDAIPIGSIQAFAGETLPTGWLLCDGSAISRSAYSELFNIIGTIYGEGDGSTTFNLPNLQSRVPVGIDSSDSNLKPLR